MNRELLSLAIDDPRVVAADNARVAHFDECMRCANRRGACVDGDRLNESYWATAVAVLNELKGGAQ